jgi:ubiquinone/menaquinone biosynthesis C-methylase UbiE
MPTIPTKMHKHFSQIAATYNDLRTTDLKPVLFIRNKLKHLSRVKAADVGCGAGRYDLLLFKQLNNLHLTCVDINKSMIDETAYYLKSNGITNFKTITSEAHDLPFKDNTLDCIFTFNAIHHFDFVKFLKKAPKMIKKAGAIFIYTRLQSQNARNIWGRFFPLFLKQENRLYEFQEIESMINSSKLLVIDSFKNFRFKRRASLKQLLTRARKRHYSTFSLYNDNELEKSIRSFQNKITGVFSNPDKIEWFDENIMLILRHRSM